jgi:hypothetical protein
VISHNLWQERLGGAADIIGSSIIVERVPAITRKQHQRFAGRSAPDSRRLHAAHAPGT